MNNSSMRPKRPQNIHNSQQRHLVQGLSAVRIIGRNLDGILSIFGLSLLSELRFADGLLFGVWNGLLGHGGLGRFWYLDCCRLVVGH